MRSLTIPAIAALALAIVACDGSTGPAGGGSNDYFPLTEGNYWDYDLTGYIYTATGDSIEVTGYIYRDITGTASHQGGFSVYIMVEQHGVWAGDTSFIYTDTTYVYRTDTELRQYFDLQSSDHVVLAELPFEVGNSWTSDTLETVTVLSLTETVTTVAGTFENCAYLQLTHQDDPDAYQEYYLAPGVGLVLLTDYDEDGATTDDVEYGLYDYWVE